MVYSGSERHNLSLNVDGKVNDKLRVNARFQFDQRNIWGAGVAGNGTTENGSSTDARFNKMAQILQYRPTIGIQGSDEELLAGRDPLLVDESGNVVQNQCGAESAGQCCRRKRRPRDTYLAGKRRLYLYLLQRIHVP